MPQFFVPRKNLRGTFFVFPPSESRHLVQVLRKKEGDIVQIFDGEGLVAFAQITDISDPNAVKAKFSSLQSAAACVSNAGRRAFLTNVPSGSQAMKQREVTGRVVHLYPALIRSERFEWMLEKATELGVCSIHPIFSKRSVVKFAPSDFERKRSRWKKIALAAAKQSGRKELPRIFFPLNFNDAIQQCKREIAPVECSALAEPRLAGFHRVNLILWESEEENNLFEFLTDLPLIAVNLFVGPEGGFTIEEVTLAKKAGFQSVRIGENILRAETATIAAVSLLTLT